MTIVSEILTRKAEEVEAAKGRVSPAQIRQRAADTTDCTRGVRAALTRPDARALTRLLKDIPAKTNLIPFNPWPGAPYECSSRRAIDRFARILNDAGLSAPIRSPRGLDIMAACGQLKSASERLKKSAREAAAAGG